MGKSVLIVDDDPEVVHLCHRVLDESGLHVRTAPNGAACLMMVANEEPDLIILDVIMPVMDGFQTLRVLRSHGLRTPVLMLTGCSNDVDIAHAWNLRVSAYLTKPFDVDQLVLMTHRLLEAGAEPDDAGFDARSEPASAHPVAEHV
jgi:DNA-binding response OmpR family regulator